MGPDGGDATGAREEETTRARRLPLEYRPIIRKAPCFATQAMAAELEAVKQASAKLKDERARMPPPLLRWLPVCKLHLELLYKGNQTSTGVGILGAFGLQLGRCLLSCFEVGRYRLCGIARRLSGVGLCSSKRVSARVVSCSRARCISPRPAPRVPSHRDT